MVRGAKSMVAPPALPFVGHALALRRNPLRFFAEIRSYGDIVPIRLGPAKAYVVNTPDLMREVLVVQARNFDKGVQVEKARAFLGNGLVSSDGDYHRRQRRLVQPAFRASRIPGYGRIMSDVVTRHVSAWQDGQVLAVDQELNKLTLTIVAKTMFATDFSMETAMEIRDAMRPVLAGVTRRMMAPFGVLTKLPTPESRRFNSCIRRLHEIIDRVITQYRASGEDHGDLLSMMLLARDREDATGMTDLQLRDEVMAVLFAGSETVANSVAWTFHVLGANPEIEHRLHAEVDGVVNGRTPQYEDLPQLPYTRRVFTEALRMYGPPWMLSRRTTAEIELGGVRIPAGASVLFSPNSMQRDPAIYPDPDTFDPDRWLGNEIKTAAKCTYLPFSAGNRQCIGDSYAWVSSVTILGGICSRWRLTPAPGSRVRPTIALTLVPSELPMKLHRRQDTGAPPRPAAGGRAPDAGEDVQDTANNHGSHGTCPVTGRMSQ
jgi:pentalenene oxygenase